MKRMTGLSCMIAATLCLMLGNVHAANDAAEEAPPQAAPDVTNDQPKLPSAKESDTGKPSSQSSETPAEPECN